MSTKIGKGLQHLFRAEISNEHNPDTGNSRDGSCSPGGVTPATLGSCLDSVQQGLRLKEEDMDSIAQELRQLIRKQGEDTEVRRFG